MPWFPEFVSAAELARSEIRAAARADPVHQYLTALDRGDTHALENAWPGEVVVYDPRAGEVRGHRRLRQFVSRSKSLLAARHASIETVTATWAGRRAVVELLVHLNDDGGEVDWPVAVVAESVDDLSMMFRTYASQLPVDGRHHLRPPILVPGQAHPGEVVGRYQAALAAGDVEAVVTTFAPDGYYREAIGAHGAHRGPAELRAFFAARLHDGGIGLQLCAVTDDGVRCAVEYNCVRWGSQDLSPQAGIAVYERAPDGLLAAARVYDDVEAPAEQS